MSKGFICNVLGAVPSQSCKLFTTNSDEKKVFAPKDVNGEGWWKIEIQTSGGGISRVDVCGDHKTVIVSRDGNVYDPEVK